MTCGKVVLYSRSAFNPLGDSCALAPGHDGPCAAGPGIVGRHWIEPSAEAKARPRNAVTSAAPPPDSPSLPPDGEEAMRLLDEVLTAHDRGWPWSPVTTAAIRDVVARWRGAA